MTAHTIRKVGNAFFAMFALNFGLVVFVAGIASVGANIFNVAGFTRIPTAFAVIHGEGVRLLKAGRLPGIGGVAGFTRAGECAQVESWLCMARGALLRSAAKDVVYVALLTGNGLVRTGERERG